MMTKLPRWQGRLPEAKPLDAFAAAIPRTSDGQAKSRLTWAEKLHALDPTSTPEQTTDRLTEFAYLFAPRKLGAIITSASGGPRSWVALRGFLQLKHIVRHLLADRVSTLRPQWVGSRSFASSILSTFDVDPDRRPGDRDDEGKLQRKSKKPTLSFEGRCLMLETALSHLGINAHDPRQVLLSPTPSGGRHYTLFFDARHFLDQYHQLWNLLGLRHVPGQLEFYPSTGHAIRLPFGHVPGQPHDPTAWIHFIDAYRQRRIRRHNLEHLYHRATTLSRSTRVVANVNPGVLERENAGKMRNDSSVPGRAAVLMGVPKRFRTANINRDRPDAQERYTHLLEHGIHSLHEADELFALGIRVEGTRTAALNLLAAHLVWWRGQSAEQAAAALTTWAHDPRHASKDLVRDRERGTDKVGAQITTMCAWYESHRDPERQSSAAKHSSPLEYAPEELHPLRNHIEQLPDEARSLQADFYLRFLRLAKRHGRPAPDGTGWDAAASVNKVIRRWPGCNKMDYKKRMNHASAAGLFQLVKEKYQAPPGKKGRARTYRLSVPVTTPAQWTLDYEQGRRLLLGDAGTGPLEEQQATNNGKGDEVSEARSERQPAYEPAQEAVLGDHHPERGGATAGAIPTAVPAASAGVSLAPGPHQRPAKPDAAAGLFDPPDGELEPVPEPAEECNLSNEPEFGSPEWIERNRRETEAIIQQYLSYPDLPPTYRTLLERDPLTLTTEEVQQRVALVSWERKRRRLLLEGTSFANRNDRWPVPRPRPGGRRYVFHRRPSYVSPTGTTTLAERAPGFRESEAARLLEGRAVPR